MNEPDPHQKTRGPPGRRHLENVLKERESALKDRDTSLKYGHPGIALYNVEKKEWEFSRSTAPYLLKRISDVTTAVPSPLRESPLCQKKWNVSQTLPEAVPASDFLPRDERLSKNIIHAAEYYDPVLSTRLVFSHAINSSTKLPDKAVPIVAFAGGECGEKVGFTVLQHAEFGWSEERETTLRVPETRGAEAWWEGYGAPVQQIEAAETARQDDAWIAVQFATSTTIFHPLLYSPSIIIPNPVATIPMSRTGGAPLVNVAFNPWNPRQISILDRRMNWTIWYLDGRGQGRPAWEARLVSFGDLHVEQEAQFGHSPADHVGGWGRVCWATADDLLVCNRRQISLYHNKNGTGNGAGNGSGADLDILRDSEWILDMKSSGIGLAGLFVLTSKRILWLQVGGDPAQNEGDEDLVRAEVLLSWRHFRASDDMSLHLQLFNLDNSALVFVNSRLNNLASIFRFSYSPTSSTVPISLSDPASLTLLPGDILTPDLGLSGYMISTIGLREAEYGLQLEEPGTNVGWKYYSLGIQFFTLTILTADLSVKECLLAIQTTQHLRGGATFQAMDIQPPLIRKSEIIVADSTLMQKMNRHNLIASDDEAEVPMWKIHYVPVERLAKRRVSGPADGRCQWTVDSESLYLVAAGLSGSSGKDTNCKSRSLDSFLDEMHQMLLSMRAGFTTLRTLLDIYAQTPRVDDIDKASRLLAHLVESTSCLDPSSLSGSIDVIGLENLWLPATLSQAGGEGQQQVWSMSKIYDYLVRIWLKILPAHTPSQVRVIKEKVLREIATELALAKVLLRPRENARAIEIPSEVLPLPDLVLPVRRKSSIFRGKERESQRTHTSSGSIHSTLSTPSPSLDPQSFSIASSSNDSYQRLRAYTTVSRLPPLPKAMSNILAHWSEGLDPKAYNWERREAQLAEPTAEDQEVQAKALAQQRKKEDQKREFDGRLSYRSDAQTPMGMGVRAQKSQAPAAVLASSQVADQPMLSTQTERGIYGGRHAFLKAAAKERKKRPEGFR